MKIWHPYTQEAADAPSIAIDRGEGAYLFTRDGRRFIDAISSWWVNLHGHAHPLIAEAIAEQARKLEHVIFAGFTHEPAEELGFEPPARKCAERLTVFAPEDKKQAEGR